MDLTHLDDSNNPNMVDVSAKDDTLRVAIASGVIKVSKEAYDVVISNTSKKGPVLQTAIIAAISGAKKTSDLIPMCHPLMLTSVKIDVQELPSLPGFKMIATAKITGKTGVEMEALSAVSIGLLTIYDMLKAIDQAMVIGPIQLEHKSGGKSGTFNR